jgi:hypothetical protein
MGQNIGDWDAVSCGIIEQTPGAMFHTYAIRRL